MLLQWDFHRIGKWNQFGNNDSHEHKTKSRFLSYLVTDTFAWYAYIFLNAKTQKRKDFKAFEAKKKTVRQPNAEIKRTPNKKTPLLLPTDRDEEGGL